MATARARALTNADCFSHTPSHQLFAEPSQTVLFLDWDDTIFPTTILFRDWGLPARAEAWADLALDARQREELRGYREALLAHLRCCGANSECCAIVTNARRPWVHDCVRAFAPEVQALLDDGSVRVVYAQEARGALKRGVRPVRHSAWNDYDMSPEEHQAHFTATKIAAMRAEVGRFYSSYPGQTWKNIVSFGDASFEHRALQEVAFTRKSPSRERLRAKALRCAVAPTLREFATALRLRSDMIRPIVAFDGDVDLDVSEVARDERFGGWAEALGLPTEAIGPSTAKGDTTLDRAEDLITDAADRIENHLSIESPSTMVAAPLRARAKGRTFYEAMRT